MKLFREATSELLVLQKRERFTFGMLDLIDGAVARVFVGTPAKKFCAVPESATGKMILRDFHDDSWIEWLPLASAIRAPTAGSSRRVASEAGWFFKRFKSFR